MNKKINNKIIMDTVFENVKKATSDEKLAKLVDIYLTHKHPNCFAVFYGNGFIDNDDFWDIMESGGDDIVDEIRFLSHTATFSTDYGGYWSLFTTSAGKKNHTLSDVEEIYRLCLWDYDEDDEELETIKDLDNIFIAVYPNYYKAVFE